MPCPDPSMGHRTDLGIPLDAIIPPYSPAIIRKDMSIEWNVKQFAVPEPLQLGLPTY